MPTREMDPAALQPITDASAWRGADLEADRSWCVTLQDRERAELRAAAAALADRPEHLARLDAGDAPLPGLQPLLARITQEVQHGRGMAVLRGFPVDGLELATIEKLYWVLCAHLGTGITQNSDATLIHYVTEGRLRPNQGSRGVGVPTESTPHVDLTDCASLLCVRQAPDDPPSWLASSTHVFNEILRSSPDLLEPLFEGFEWDRLGEHGPHEAPTTGYKVPVFSRRDGVLSCRYNRYWMAAADRRHDRHNTAEQRRALDLFDEIAARDRLAIRFEPGDIQFVNNYTVLHGRAAHEPQTEEARMRLLMRIWLDFPQPRALLDEAVMRYGVVRHGNLGWTAAEVRNGLVGTVRSRRADGATVLAATGAEPSV
ncbi:MAG: TauD/TfdA family dioxygenase [Acidimicrobiales bacterium]